MCKDVQTPAPDDPVPSGVETRLTPEAIIRQLQHVPEKCDFAPYEAALLAAAEQRDAIVPDLIAAIDRVTADPVQCLKRHEDCLHEFAIYLLAQFRETRALDAFLRFFSLPEDLALDLTGDLVTESGAVVLASVCGGDPAPLLRLIRDETVNEFVRGQAVEGLLVQFAWGERPREAVIADLRDLFATLPKPGSAQVWAELVIAVSDFNVLELLPEVRRAFVEELVDESIVGLEDVDPEAPGQPGGYVPPTPEQRFRWFCERSVPMDAVAECSTWFCFRDEADETGYWDDGPDEDWDEAEEITEAIAPAPQETPYYEAAPTPYIAPPKIGRNEPCPCGSGKKYKKCCGK